MSGVPFPLVGKGGFEFDLASLSSIWSQEKKGINSFSSTEPTSVLHMRRSPSSPTSASTLSGGGATDTPTEKSERKDEWAALQPIPTAVELGGRCGIGLEDWENMLSEPNQEQSLLRWIAGDVDDSFGLRQAPPPADFHHGAVFEAIGGANLTSFGSSGFNNNVKVGSLASPPSSSVGLMNPRNPIFGYHQIEGKPQILDPQMLNQNPNFFTPLPFSQPGSHFFQPQSKRHDAGDSMLQFHQKPPPMAVKQEETGGQQQQPLLDELYKAAELLGSGNYSHAQGILARLNQHLTPIGKPIQRAAFYFKEALQLPLVTNSNPVSGRTPAPLDVFFKMGAYKVFSEVSPVIQFINFTCNQAIHEAIGDSKRIHIVDFDIGFGAQWASFMQELRGAPSLKITAFVSPSTHHPIEVLLMRENLSQFAIDNGITFELDIVNFDSLLDQSCHSLFRSSKDESVAVNFPVWCSSSQPSSLPYLLRFVKQLSPLIVVSLDRGFDRTDLPFPRHILHSLQSHVHLLESLDAVNVAADAVNKIEKFLLQPSIESSVLGRLRSPERMANWKTVFASSGFMPVNLSNLSESQAECVVNRTPVRGFHVERRQGLLVLSWQGRELMSASAWRC